MSVVRFVIVVTEGHRRGVMAGSVTVMTGTAVTEPYQGGPWTDNTPLALTMCSFQTTGIHQIDYYLTNSSSCYVMSTINSWVTVRLSLYLKDDG